MATKKQMAVLNKKYPELTASDISELLSCNSGWVRSTAKRNKINLPKGNRRMDTSQTLKRATAKSEAEAYVKSDQWQKDTTTDE